MVIQALLFSESKWPRKCVNSKKLIGVQRTLLEDVKKCFHVFLVSARFDTDHAAFIVSVLKDKSKTLLYLNNAATGFDDELLQNTVVSLAKDTEALFCVANPAKCLTSKVFEEFALQHVSRKMFRYKYSENLYVMS
jgi:hypothetical protein